LRNQTVVFTESQKRGKEVEPGGTAGGRGGGGGVKWKRKRGGGKYHYAKTERKKSHGGREASDGDRGKGKEGLFKGRKVSFCAGAQK